MEADYERLAPLVCRLSNAGWRSRGMFQDMRKGRVRLYFQMPPGAVVVFVRGRPLGAWVSIPKRNRYGACTVIHDDDEGFPGKRHTKIHWTRHAPGGYVTEDQIIEIAEAADDPAAAPAIMGLPGAEEIVERLLRRKQHGRH